MRKALSVSALILAFVCSAHAGEIQNDFTGTPPQSPATVTQQPTTDREIQNDAAATLTQVALDMLAVLPSLP
jgi:hypothetical protein